MSDLTLNCFLARGTTAERTAFTPDPPTPASGPPAHAVLWYDTDVGGIYSWNGSGWDLAIAGSITVTEIDSAPDVSGVSTIRFSNGTVTDDGGGQVTVDVGGAGGALVLLEQHTASSSATLDFTSWYSSAYDEYMIELIGLVPATDAVNLLLTVSTDGGSNWSSTNYRYGVMGATSSGGAPSGGGSNSTSSILLGGTVENTTSTTHFSGSIRLFNPGSTTRVKGFMYDTVWQGSDGNYYRWSGSGVWADTANDIDALRFAFSSGDIAEGTIRIYGIAKS